MTQSAASDIGVGTVLRDTYEITSLLGKGGMGAVYLARHRRLPGKQVAVKVLLNSASLNPELYARFRREAEIASQLGHPNIVEVSDFDTLQDGTPFLVMEYLRGESLEHRMQRGRLSLTETLALMRQMGSALQAAHRAGVVHRDLKPANVFLVPTDSEGMLGERVKLLDFGISKMIDSRTLQTQEAVLIGTPQYMAPEQAMGKNSEVGPRTDLFALGCIVYEMLSGQAPFAGEGSSLVQVIFRVVHAQPEPLGTLCPELPRQVIDAVEQALAKSPADRPADVSAFIASLTGVPLAAPTGAAVPLRSQTRSGESSGTAQFGAPAGGAPDDGLGSTHMPSGTARFAAPAVAAKHDDGLDSTHMPVSTARFTPAAVAEHDDGLGSTHMPASTARFTPAAVAEPPRAPLVLATPAPAPPAPALVSPAPVPSAPKPVAPVIPRPVAARASPWIGVVSGLVVLLVAIVAAVVWHGHSTSQPQTPVELTPEQKQALTAQAPVREPSEAARPPESPTAPITGPSVPTPPSGIAVPVPPVSGIPGPTPPTAHPGTHVASKGPEESLPEEVRQALQEAESELGQGHSDAAYNLARQTLNTKLTGGAFSVMTRASCSQHDTSRAKAKWREGQRYFSPSARAKVLKFCKQQDIEIDLNQ